LQTYKIGDLALATGIRVETIRYYERVGLLNSPGRTAGKHRVYSPEDLAQLKFIVRAREMGFSQADVRLLISLSAGDSIACDDVRSIAERHFAAISARMAMLRNVEALLSSAVTQCTGGKGRNCAVIDLIEVASERRNAG
jgi:MerR family mercuric resistance operon transcriptional regulator